MALVHTLFQTWPLGRNYVMGGNGTANAGPRAAQNLQIARGGRGYWAHLELTDA